jgi:AraC family transcriptional regulator of adaptative response / DNA-3-methyladenine glycosylase II
VDEVTLTPVQPYSLGRSAWGSNPTRQLRDGVLETVFEAGGEPVHARVWQRRDGSLSAQVTPRATDAALAKLRFLLAVDIDHRPFLEIAATDPLLHDTVSRNRGLRPMRTATVAHSLVQAVAGQLITAREAWLIERRIVSLIGRPHVGMTLPPTSDDLRSVSAAQLARTGLAPRRAAALARVVRTLDLERLRDIDTSRTVARITRERTLGPWSAGVIALGGLGRVDHGLVGDLGLIRLCTHLRGRPATADDTQRLLERYEPWAGLASVHLLHHPLARTRSRAA